MHLPFRRSHCENLHQQYKEELEEETKLYCVKQWMNLREYRLPCLKLANREGVTTNDGHNFLRVPFY